MQSLEPATAIKKTEEDGKSVIIMKRKCVDILCLIFFVLFWGTCAFLIVYYKAWLNIPKADVLFVPHDSFRRRCGANSSNQADPLATDYSILLTDVYDFKTFCEDSKKVYNHPYMCDTIFSSSN